jgi:GAF domain-containing protein
MAGAGADPWPQDYPGPGATGTAGRRGQLRDASAACAEPATRARWSLEDPAGARRVHEAAGALYDGAGPVTLPDRVLAGALALTGADRGNVQLISPRTGALRIVAQAGFGTEFLEYFAVVDDDESACGRAARQRAQTVVTDARTDPAFARHRHIAAASGFRAAWSVPLIDRDGRLHGVVSTHYPAPLEPTARDRLVLAHYAELAAQAFAGAP